MYISKQGKSNPFIAVQLTPYKHDSSQQKMHSGTLFLILLLNTLQQTYCI